MRHTGEDKTQKLYWKRSNKAFLKSGGEKKEQRLSLSVLCALPFKVTSLFHRPHMRKRLRLRFWLGAGAGGSMLVLRCSCCWWVFISRRLGVFFFFFFWFLRGSFWTRQLLLFAFCTSLHFNFAPLRCSAQFSSTWLKARFKLVWSIRL